MISDARKAHSAKSGRFYARKRLAQRPGVHATRNKKYLVLATTLYIGIAVTGLYVAAGSQEMRALFQQMSDNQKYRDSLLAEHSRLLLERATHSTYQNIDRIAETQLHMKFPEQAERLAQVAN